MPITDLSCRRRAPAVARMLRLVAISCSLVLAAGCAHVEELIEEVLDSRTPRERYEESLGLAGLDGRAIVADWRGAAERALVDAALVQGSHTESGFMSSAEPIAFGYRVNLKRGQKVDFRFELEGDSATLLFIELWRHDENDESPLSRISAADSGERTLSFSARQDGAYIVRVQPELLRGGRFTVQLNVLPTLAFPVQGGKEHDIGSVYGDPRDGGARSHRGIDIFARRGTPAVAAVAGTAYRVETTPVGGKVVWLRDSAGNRLYYAHLDSQTVVQGQEVQLGDTVGFVGNTGNARTTPPHLHFGVYSRGAVDPYWFVHQPRAGIMTHSASIEVVGEWARARNSEVKLLRDPDRKSAATETLEEGAVFRVVAVAGEWYRIVVPDGRTGYLSAAAVEQTTSPLYVTATSVTSPLMRMPGKLEVHGELAANRDAEVLGHFGDYKLVRAAELVGWVSADAVVANSQQTGQRSP